MKLRYKLSLVFLSISTLVYLIFRLTNDDMYANYPICLASGLAFFTINSPGLSVMRLFYTHEQGEPAWQMEAVSMLMILISTACVYFLGLAIEYADKVNNRVKH